MVAFYFLAAPVIVQNPPSMMSLNVGQTFTITCRAVGVPTPQIMWRLNWHHVPSKCVMTSENGFGEFLKHFFLISNYPLTEENKLRNVMEII